MSLTPPLKVGKLQTALHTKAKNSPDYRFYALYDKVYRRDVLAFAYVRSRNNGGVPGVDGQSFDDIEKSGRDQWLDELAEELRSGTYSPQPVKRVYIPKGDGKPRPLGIPCIKDRVVQTAVMLVLEPIFEADLEPEQHAYRPERSALDAVRLVERLVRSGHTEVVDADLSGYFDSIPHAELMKSVSRRISDSRVLRLLKMWLETPVQETDAKGNCHRTTRNKAMTVMRTMMSKLKLTVNEQKTRLCRLPEETFDFLGYTLGRNYDCRTGESYLGPRPAQKKIDRLCGAIGELTERRKAGFDVAELIGRINRKLRGWSNYFRLGTVSKAYRNIDSHTRYRVRQWLCAKFKVPGQGRNRFPDEYLYQELGLYQLQRTKRQRFVGERV